jgi:hypothetical protein
MRFIPEKKEILMASVKHTVKMTEAAPLFLSTLKMILNVPVLDEIQRTESIRDSLRFGEPSI